ncbi:SlyX family protein [Falsirhodobacter xinxiangensis]|uniref:SlyX family protein n=1 Tax=Falsirhodobacter xinxiangensis TaxID=2530049 RepID=UPI001FE7FEDD|nr:SlyX family protein [Rhodobacter xinxiangensis]
MAASREGQMDRTEKLEEQIAHLTRTVDELSEIVARQERELALTTRRVGLLLEREAERQADEGGTIPLADQRPPHW